MIAAYAVEWTFRGYMDYQFLRTINLRFIVPWYDSIPQIGTVLFLAGWWHSRRTKAGDRRFSRASQAANTNWRASA